MSITERLVNKDLFVPYDENDPQRDILVGKIIENQQEIIRFESEIKILKDKMKPHVEDRDDAIDDLTKGQRSLVKCKETIFWDENRVETIRLDCAERLPDREINEEDRNCHTDDVDVE